jgi:hypothetical protein
LKPIEDQGVCEYLRGCAVITGLLISCRTYRLERQSIIKITKQYKDEPGPLKFAHFFKNATIVDEILKFLEKIGIVTRNWLQNQGRMEEEGVDEGIEEGEK